MKDPLLLCVLQAATTQPNVGGDGRLGDEEVNKRFRLILVNDG